MVATGRQNQGQETRGGINLTDDMSDLERRAFDGIRAAQKLAHATATNAGWYRDPKTGEQIKRNFGEVVALMHLELSEALEADRKGPDG